MFRVVARLQSWHLRTVDRNGDLLWCVCLSVFVYVCVFSPLAFWVRSAGLLSLNPTSCVGMCVCVAYVQCVDSTPIPTWAPRPALVRSLLLDRSIPYLRRFIPHTAHSAPRVFVYSLQFWLRCIARGLNLCWLWCGHLLRHLCVLLEQLPELLLRT